MDDEIVVLVSRFTGLTASGTTKKRAIKVMEEEPGRGRWAILKMLEKQCVLAARKSGRIR